MNRRSLRQMFDTVRALIGLGRVRGSHDLDYVVAGFGIGAILALIGFALWELYGNVEEPGKSWLSRAAIGFMLGALVIWSITGVSLISHIDDSTGSQLVLLTTLVTLVSIAGVTFFYWRADRALAATLPRPAKAPASQTAAGALAPPAVLEDIELTEWDSWPEREAGQQDAPEAESGDAQDDASFEAEVAVEAVVAPEPRLEPEEPEASESDAADAPTPRHEEPAEAAPDSDGPAGKIEVGRPANVLPFRLPAPPEAPALVAGDDVPPAEADAAAVDGPLKSGKAAEPDERVPIAPLAAVEDIKDDPDPDFDEEGAGDLEDQASEADDLERQGDRSAPTVFESSLLADVDSSLAAGDGGYRSPLLSDLGSDKLEGVGLAKWNPEARLTDDEGAPPQAKSGRRR